MKMYAVIDTEWNGRKPERYFLEFGDAETYIDGCTRYDRVHTMETGGIPGREYLQIKIVERNSQPCKCCGREASNDEEQFAQYPYCRDCHYNGASLEDSHEVELSVLRNAFPGASIDAEHTGGGCFWLAFRWDDDPIFYIATAGEATLPDDWNAGWGVVCRYLETEDGDIDESCYEDEPVVVSDHFGDHGPATFLSLVQVIAAIQEDRAARVAA